MVEKQPLLPKKHPILTGQEIGTFAEKASNIAEKTSKCEKIKMNTNEGHFN